MLDKIYDVIVIGGGPAGSSCALYTSRAKLSTIVIDKAPGAGSLAVTSRIANYPGVRGEVSGRELADTMREQARDFGAEYVKEGVIGVDFEMEPKRVYTTEGIYHSRTVVVAAGALERKSRIPGEEDYLGRGVSYCATCDAAFFTEKEVAVVGDGDHAVEDAIFLARFASKVHLIVPRSELKSWRELTESAVDNPGIVIHYDTIAKSVRGNDMAEGLEIVRHGGRPEVLPIDGIFMLLSGTAPTTDFLAGALPLTEEGCVAVRPDKSTDVPGVYAVGDVTCKQIKQVVIAAADGVTAALAIDKYLNKRSRTRLDYK